MHSSLTQIAHRPWPPPTQKWAWRQSWNELLFVHYRCDAALLRSLVPPELKIQEFDGSSWIGIVPFQMNHVMRRPLPDIPGFSNFLELNVRLYVEYEGVPGVWFLSLDATNPLVVWGGQRFFGLPYMNADIEAMPTPIGEGHYRSLRQSRIAPAEFEVHFKTFGEDHFAKPGTLEHFLTERYCFYSVMKNGLHRSEVHHWPWPLKKVTGEVLQNSLLEPHLNGNKISDQEPLFHFSHGVDVVCWNPVRA
jgi:uncharacterized protein